MSGTGLNGYLLTGKEQKRMASRSEEVSLQGLHELVDDERLGPAARTAIRCVVERGADPRLLLLVIEAAEEGEWWTGIYDREVCVNGHYKSPENTYTRPDGTRECRACRKELRQARRAAGARG